ncbi:MAG TPA: hypothetical protein VG722_00550 [Tepidisphaeraceae bacterium]|nr:hypothetical protein [Tepidisphaeraceae bacterium]
MKDEKTKDETDRERGGECLPLKRQARRGLYCHVSCAGGFTLVELLVVIGIIVLLIGILLPVVSRVRQRAYATGVEAQIAALKQAIDQYYSDFHSYPGPVSNQVMGTTAASITYDPNYTTYVGSFTSSSNFLYNNTNKSYLTGPENLVLGLIGGLRISGTNVYYNPMLVGQGPASLNTAMPKKYGAYIDTSDLSPDFNGSAKNGLYSDGAASGGILDTPIPEILDRFPNRMPILYLRANVGAVGYAPPTGTVTYTPADATNPVVIDASTGGYASATSAAAWGGTAPITRYAQYDISQIDPYTSSTIGEGKTAVQGSSGKTTTHGLNIVGAGDVLTKGATGYVYPYPAYPYIRDPNSPDTNPYARAKDSYILISAGPDRIYGTSDDITSFGPVNP